MDFIGRPHESEKGATSTLRVAIALPKHLIPRALQLFSKSVSLGTWVKKVKRKSGAAKPQPSSVGSTWFYELIVKNHVFGWAPVRVGSWSSALPAKSFAPVVTTAL